MARLSLRCYDPTLKPFLIAQEETRSWRRRRRKRHRERERLTNISITNRMQKFSRNPYTAVPEVDKKLLGDLESMGFPTARATRALHYSGNCNLEDAINWIVEHEDDPDIDQMPLVPINIEIETGKPSWFPEVKMKAQELWQHARQKQQDEEKRIEREREKERIKVGKELLEARRVAEENERKRFIALRKAEKEEEKRAREKIRQRLQQDKEERRRKLGLSPEGPARARLTTPVQEMKISFPVKPISRVESMRNCLRSLKKHHKDDDVKVKRAYQTLLRLVGNVAKNPDVEKFRKIRISNPTFQDRVGSLKGGIEFLELCGFEKVEGSDFLFLPRDKVDMLVLNLAGSELNSAMTNPFFGLF